MALAIGVVSLPYLTLDYGNVGGELQRAGLEASGLASPNALSTWFGFLCLYLIIRGIETSRMAVYLGGNMGPNNNEVGPCGERVD